MAATKRRRAGESRMLRRGISPKKAMLVLDKAFQAAGQPVPVMCAYYQDPIANFITEAGSLIASWPPRVLRHVVTTLTKLEPGPSQFALATQVTKLLNEVLGVGTVHDAYGKSNSRWRLWPRIRATVKFEVNRSKELTQEEREAMSKVAVKKKVTPAKAKGVREPKAEKPTKPVLRGASLGPDVKIKVGKNKSKLSYRKKIAAAVGGGTVTVAALMKKTGCKAVSISSMVKKGFLAVAK